MGTARRLHTATLLRDGRVLIAGGFVCCVVEGQTASETSTASAELYDPATNVWHPGPMLQAAWRGATATLLGNGKVLVFGGEGASGFPKGSTLLFE